MVSLVTRPFSCRAFVRVSAGRKAWKSGQASLRDLSSDTFTSIGEPLTPVSFGEGFRISEEPTPLFLAQRHTHVLDGKIQFEEGPHEYFYEGKKMSISVTGLVESFFEKFDPDEAIERMKNGSKWPRPEYTRKSGEVWTNEQIKAFWDGVGLYARNRGTWMHYNIERFLNNLAPSQDCAEMPLFNKFYGEIMQKMKIEPWRTEWRICAPEYGLAGSVDFVGKLPDNTFVIMDWKRSKNLAGSLDSSYGKRARAPLEHIDDTDASKYFLQLNIYRYILQKHYDMRVSKMVLASFHPSSDEYFQVEVPLWEAEVEAALRHLVGRTAGDTAEIPPESVERSSPRRNASSKTVVRPKMTRIANPFA
jgi:hypothetical protein